ncbi:hypothetical protein FAES_2325 [Fibrella aestuarina BUZ 2]|uniref:Uncharacterized protein n=1 Tax=Fibrella aestuarina BUZ 2 TaxID=1166018 RepID=I0K881_9BACT|nr:hypothetical protein FAES_2325 [Fibrella aestuarina BUZ 2]
MQLYTYPQTTYESTRKWFFIAPPRAACAFCGC